MLAARRRFLDAGYYEPLAKMIAERAADAVEAASSASGKGIVEVGSGTGYYIRYLRARLPPDDAYVGIDISKEALKVAARAEPRVTYALADVKRRIPILDGAALVLLDIFAPRNSKEFRRVLADDGALVVVVPDTAHMAELVHRFGLLKVPEDKAAEVTRELGDDLRLSDRQSVSYELRLPTRAAHDMIAMGPSARHVDLRKIERELDHEVTVTASFIALEFRRR
jgi:23S rRNA (guanine745-N1)-methyltransferase